ISNDFAARRAKSRAFCKFSPEETKCLACLSKKGPRSGLSNPDSVASSVPFCNFDPPKGEFLTFFAPELCFRGVLSPLLSTGGFSGDVLPLGLDFGEVSESNCTAEAFFDFPEETDFALAE
ncbi:hypothetical protein PanWU01x14_056690, partial [Parasponia andersonii]